MVRKEDAIREGLRAVELKPESKDAYDGAIMNCFLALIYARVGENDLAIPLIERLLRTPGAVDSVDYSITVNDLRFRWEWDPLRSDQRFEKRIEGRPPCRPINFSGTGPESASRAAQRPGFPLQIAERRAEMVEHIARQERLLARAVFENRDLRSTTANPRTNARGIVE